jgi:hypothetical protein
VQAQRSSSLEQEQCSASLPRPVSSSVLEHAKNLNDSEVPRKMHLGVALAWPPRGRALGDCPLTLQTVALTQKSMRGHQSILRGTF